MKLPQALVLVTAIAALVGCTPAADPAWSGYIEGEYVYVAAPLAGRLTALSAQRGQTVARGAPLFALDDQSERAASQEAQARSANAKAQASNTDKGRRAEEIAVIQAQLVQARAQAALASSELSRQQQLLAQGFVSDSRVDDARTSARLTQARVTELQAALKVAQLPARSDERAAAAANVSAAEQVLEQVRWREQQKHQQSPADALVTDTFFRIGEWVVAGQPVVALLPPGATKARFFVPEPELGGIRLGQAVTIHCDGCGAPIAARIDFIAPQAEYTPPVIYSNAQRSRLVFMVEARPDAQDGARLKPGQPVDVRRGG